MKYILSFIGICLVVLSVIFFKNENGVKNKDYLRIYISSNSPNKEDEQIKYLVKDVVVDFLIPKLSEAKTKEDAEIIIKENIEKLNEVVGLVLEKENVCYDAKISIEAEKVPLRVYGDLVLEEGVYDCLKIDLGQAKGQSWWCVVFPAVCFVSSKKYENLEYISKIWEIINNVT